MRLAESLYYNAPAPLHKTAWRERISNLRKVENPCVHTKAFFHSFPGRNTRRDGTLSKLFSAATDGRIGEPKERKKPELGTNGLPD